MRKSGPRLYGIAVPAAALVGSLTGNTEAALFLMEFYLLSSLASLGAIDAFQRTSAKLMSTRKVMGALLTAVMMIIALTGALGLIRFGPPDALGRERWLWLAAGGILAVNRCFEELFASQGDPGSARLTDLLTFIALAACLLIPMEAETLPLAVCIAAGAATLIGGMIAIGFARKEPPQLNLAIFKEIPAALLRTALFPAACLVLLPLLSPSGQPGNRLSLLEPAACLGFMLIEIAKTPFKRDKFDASGLKTGVALSVLLINCAILAAACFLPLSHAAQSMAVILAAAACALLLYGPFDWETLTAAALSIAAAALSIAAAALITIGFTPEHISFPQEIFVGPAIGLVLCALMFRQWTDLHRRRKANRIRKKALKRSRP